MSEVYPDGKISALTILYLQNQDLSSVSPEELLVLFEETWERINRKSKERKRHGENGRKRDQDIT